MAKPDGSWVKFEITAVDTDLYWPEPVKPLIKFTMLSYYVELLTLLEAVRRDLVSADSVRARAAELQVKLAVHLAYPPESP